MFAGVNMIMHFISMIVAAVAAQHEPNNALFVASAVSSFDQLIGIVNSIKLSALCRY